MKDKEIYTNNFLEQSKTIINEIEKLLPPIKNCIDKGGFPIYLSDLQILVDNLMYLNVANNAVNNERFYSNQKRLNKKRK